MKNKKSATSSMILGVAFVWFTTHFGGGVASGAQIMLYFSRTASGLRESMGYMITGLITMRFTGSLRRYFPICLKYCIFV